MRFHTCNPNNNWHVSDTFHYPGLLSSCRKQNSLTFHWLFPDQIPFFTDQNIAVLRPVCLLAADKWQIPFTSSLKCTSHILQMKQIKSLNNFLAQNVLRLKSFHSFERAREKKSTLLKSNIFFTFQIVKIPATTHILGQNYEIPWLFLDFLGIKISLTNLQNSLIFPWPWRKVKFPWLFPDQWPPCYLGSYLFTVVGRVICISVVRKMQRII